MAINWPWPSKFRAKMHCIIQNSLLDSTTLQSDEKATCKREKKTRKNVVTAIK